MDLLILIIVILIIIGLLLWAIQYLTMIPANIRMLLNVLVILIGVVFIIQRAGIVT